MKKVLIKSSAEAEDIICIFPLLHVLKEKYKADEINIIIESDYKFLLEGLPFESRCWDLPADKKSYLGIHHWAYNLHDIFNIDLSIDLEDSLKSSFINLCFNPKVRLGSRKGIRYFINNYKLRKDFEINKLMYGLDILGEFLEDDFSILKVGHKFENTEILEYPYVVLYLDELENDWALWVDILDQFDEQSFVFWTNKDKSSLDDLYSKLSKRNSYIVKDNSNLKDLGLLLENSKGLVTNQTWAAQYANYLNIDSVLINEAKLKEISFFKGTSLEFDPSKESNFDEMIKKIQAHLSI